MSEHKSTITRNSVNRDALLRLCDTARMKGGWFTITERWDGRDWFTDFVIFLPDSES